MMRMTASWLRSAHGSTEYKAVARLLRPDGETPLGSGRADLQAARLLMSVKGEPPREHSTVPRTPPNDFVRRGDKIMMARAARSPSSPAPSARRKRLWGLTAQRSRARGAIAANAIC
jgi:hypothetical protein